MLQMVSLDSIQKHHVDGPKTLVVLIGLIAKQQATQYVPGFACI